MQRVYHVVIADHSNFGRVLVDMLFDDSAKAWGYGNARYRDFVNLAEPMFKDSYELTVNERGVY